jgi:subtilisin family serine protease
MAAYGTFRYGALAPSGPPGLLGAFPANDTQLEAEFPPCRCRTTFQGDRRYAYLQGTSMAAPMVAATAAMVHHVNPGLHASDVIRLLELTATRPPGRGWTSELGWGILNAGGAVAAAKGLDRTPPVSKLTAPRRVHGPATFTLHWTGTDPQPAGLRATGIARYEVWRSSNGKRARRIRVTTATSMRLRGTIRARYAFYTRAVDNAGNREPRPAKPDARTRILRP